MDPITILLLLGASYVAVNSSASTGGASPSNTGPSGPGPVAPGPVGAPVGPGGRVYDPTKVDGGVLVANGHTVADITPVVTDDRGVRRFNVKTDYTDKQYADAAARQTAGEILNNDGAYQATKEGLKAVGNAVLSGVGSAIDAGLTYTGSLGGITGEQLKQNQVNRAAAAAVVVAPPYDHPDGANDIDWIKAYGQLDGVVIPKPHTREV